MGSSGRQTNFSTGELDPKLWGRTDLPVFGKGLRRCRNFFITKPHGAAMSRPGTLFVRETKQQNVTPTLVPFIFSDTQTYVLEFCAGVVRFHTGGATVVYVAGSVPEGVAGDPYEVLTDYTADELPNLRWVQSGDVLFIACPGHLPMKLSRLGHTHWLFEVISLSPPTAHFADIYPSPYIGTFKPAFTAVPDYDGDATHFAREWILQATVILKERTTGTLLESLPVVIDKWWNGTDPVAADMTPLQDIDSHKLTVGLDRPVTLRRPGPPLGVTVPADWPKDPAAIRATSAAHAAYLANPTPATLAAYDDAVLLEAASRENAYTLLAVNFYAGRGDLSGFIGQTKTRDFHWAGEAPDYSHPPPRGDNPFYIRDKDGVTVDIEKPAAVALFQDRLIFGGTQLRPDWFFTSVSGDYPNFDTLPLPVHGKALQYQLGSRRREGIRHLVGAGRLIALTDTSAWGIAGTTGNTLDFDSIDARPICDVGATQLPPLLVDGAVLYARSRGVGAMALMFDSNRDGYAGVDVSRSAQHLFIGQVLDTQLPPFLVATTLTRDLVSWAHAEEPWGLVWAARADGVLLSLTLDVGAQLWGWARHDTDGRVLRVCAVPEGQEDAVYLVVERFIGEHGTSKVYLERMASRVRRGTVEDDCCVDSAVRVELAVGQKIITGLEHIKGKTVWFVAKGNPPIQKTVSDTGTITLDDAPAVNVAGVGNPLGWTTPPKTVGFVGLAFTPELETLDIIGSDARLKQKTVVQVAFDIEQTSGIYTGQNFEKLVPWKQRQVAHGYAPSPVETLVAKAYVPGSWDDAARAVLRQTMPLPVTVLGITREVDVGGP